MVLIKSSNCFIEKQKNLAKDEKFVYLEDAIELPHMQN